MNIYLDNGYLDIGAILSLGQPWVFVVGGRGTGKTYGALKWVQDNNIKFMFMRRTQSQADMINRPEFSPFKALERDTNILTGTSSVSKYNAAFYRQEWAEDGSRVNVGDPIGYTCALSTIVNLRGFDASDVELLIFDEFIPEPHERPLKHEGTGLLNAYETINRNRELAGRKPLQVLALANANNISCPIFADLGLIDLVDRQYRKHQEVKVYPDKGVAVVILQHSRISEAKSATALYKMSAGTEFADMALANKFSANDYNNVCSKPLSEYKSVFSVGDVCLYKHKSRREYYACRVISGKPAKFDGTVIDMAVIKRKYDWLYFAVLDGCVYFADYYSKAKVLDIFT